MKPTFTGLMLVFFGFAVCAQNPHIQGLPGRPDPARYFQPQIGVPQINMPAPPSSFGMKPAWSPNPVVPNPTPESIMREQRAQQQAQARMYAGNSARNYDMPPCVPAQDIRPYYEAFTEIKAMLDGTQPKDLGRAVFLSENAYLKNLDYEAFNQGLENIVFSLLDQIKKEGNSIEDNTAKIMMLHRFFTDTMRIYNRQSGKYETHYPKHYDFEDPRGDVDITKQFVTKLIREESGQCHSMPFLFLILAQKMKVEAYLSTAPSHNYIRFRHQRKWYNLELTNGHLTSHSYVIGSGKVKVEAIQTRLFMDTITIEKSIAHALTDLASYYHEEFCYDAFYRDVVHIALDYEPMNASGLAALSNYYTAWFEHAKKVAGNPPYAYLDRFPQLREIFGACNALHHHLNEIGYQEMSDEEYEQWRQDVNRDWHRKTLKELKP